MCEEGERLLTSPRGVLAVKGEKAVAEREGCTIIDCIGIRV